MYLDRVVVVDDDTVVVVAAVVVICEHRHAFGVVAVEEPMPRLIISFHFI